MTVNSIERKNTQYPDSGHESDESNSSESSVKSRDDLLGRVLAGNGIRF